MTASFTSIHAPASAVVIYLTLIWGLAAGHAAFYIWYQISATRSHATLRHQKAVWNAYQRQQWNDYQQWQPHAAAQQSGTVRFR